MNRSHRDGEGHPTAQELFADVLAGLRRLDDAAVVQASTNPDFAKRLRELLAMQTQIDRAAAAEAAVAATPSAAFDVRIAEMARAQLRQRPAPIYPWRLILTLAALLFVGASTYLAWPTSKPADYKLGNQGHSGAHGLQVDPGFAAVRWKGKADLLWFLVRVRNPDGQGQDLDRSDTLRANTWIPAPRNYPDEVVIELWLVNSAADLTEGQLLTRQAYGRDGKPR